MSGDLIGVCPGSATTVATRAVAGLAGGRLALPPGSALEATTSEAVAVPQSRPCGSQAGMLEAL